MTGDFVEITDLKKKREKLFKEAEEFRKKGIMDKAISKYDEFLKIGERVKDYSRHYDAYFGMYLTWTTYLVWCINALEDISNMVLFYAPKEEYKDNWVNNKEYQEEVSNE